jgi:hypothetical protein
MLSRSISLSIRARALGGSAKLRSGLGEGLDVVMRMRKPIDVLDTHDWLALEMTPLNAAWSVIWARGDQELIRLANQLLDACSGVVSAATARMPAGTMRARARRGAAGEKWTPQMLAELQGKLLAMARAREQLAQHARKILRLSPPSYLATNCPRTSAPRRSANLTSPHHWPTPHRTAGHAARTGPHEQRAVA